MKSKPEYHRLLERQLKKFLPGYPNASVDMESLLLAINETYNQNDNDRQLMERAMLLSSEELTLKKNMVDALQQEQGRVLDALKDAAQRMLPDKSFQQDHDLFQLTDVLFAEIAKRRSAEHKNEVTEEMMSSLLNNLKLGMAEFDMEGNITSAHQRYCDIVGYTNDELIGKNSIELFANDESKESFEKVLAQHQNGDQGVFELHIRRKDGEKIWLLCSSAMITNEDGVFRGNTSVVFDITSQKLLEQELRLSRQSAEAALESRKSFLANISHEIRTPINAIVGMSGLLQQSDLSDAQREYLEALQSSAEGLQVLINDLLDVSKAESGKMELEIISVSLRRVVKNVVKSLGLKVEEKGIQLNWFIDPAVVEWHKCDPVRLTQILTNLVSNAIKFTSKGEVKIKIALVESSDELQRLYIAVVDTGIGIAHDRIASIFEEFTQEDSSTTRKYGGTGLGLSISKNLVEIMGSELIVRSEKGRGSEFYFIIDLPIGQSNEEEIQSMDVLELKGTRVLLVEDNEINRFLAVTILRSWQMDVTTANNGREALNELQQKTFDIILMDLQMPYMDGMEATEVIRKEMKLKLPIIALTANNLNSERELCLQKGMNDYVSKPFQPEQLFKKLKAYLANVRYMSRFQDRKAS
ncbi:MAG: response regulator [Flavobacteriales bacterium]